MRDCLRKVRSYPSRIHPLASQVSDGFGTPPPSSEEILHVSCLSLEIVERREKGVFDCCKTTTSGVIVHKR
jgi:hypothetical protein